MKMFRRIAAVALVAALATASAARATTLTVDTGKSLTLAPGETGTLTLSAANDAGAITDNFSGWVLGLQLVPSGVTSGTVSFGSLSNAVVNPAIVGSLAELEFLNELTSFPPGTTVNGRGNYQSLAIIDNGDANTLAGSTSYNLGDLSLTATGDADGTWNVFAVNLPSADGTRSYWYDAGFTEVAFVNIPVPSAGNTTSLLIGTVTVTSVPEPGSLTLAAVGALVAVGAAARRRLAGRMA